MGDSALDGVVGFGNRGGGRTGCGVGSNCCWISCNFFVQLNSMFRSQALYTHRGFLPVGHEHYLFVCNSEKHLSIGYTLGWSGQRLLGYELFRFLCDAPGVTTNSKDSYGPYDAEVSTQQVLI